MRKFDTGATRNSDQGKPDYEGYISPLVTWRYGEYMLAHQKQADGTIRASDNWQNGIPLDAYIKSAVRHFEDLKRHHRGYSSITTESLEDTLCAIIFNASGYLHEVLKSKAADVSHGAIGRDGYLELVIENIDKLGREHGA